MRSIQRNMAFHRGISQTCSDHEEKAPQDSATKLFDTHSCEIILYTPFLQLFGFPIHLLLHASLVVAYFLLVN